MLNEQIPSHSDDSQHQRWNLAILVGVVCIIIGMVNSIFLEALEIHVIVSGTFIENTVIFVFDNFLSIAWLVPASVGFLALFLKKNSNIGLVFPVFAIIATAGFWLIKGLLWSTPFYNGELIVLFQLYFGYSGIIIESLVLLTLRNKCENPIILYSIVILQLGLVFFLGISYLLPFGGTTDVESAFQIFLNRLPSLSISLLTSLLIIVFFLQERRNNSPEILIS